MSELPKGWVETRLGAVVELKYGKALPKNSRTSGSFSVYGSNGIVGTNEDAITAAPAIIVGRKGSFGEVKYSPEKCFSIDTTYYVDSFESVDPLFCYALLRHLPLKTLNRSTAIPGLNREDAYSLTFAIPPLAEQKRIVAKLDALNAKSAHARTELARIETLVSRYKQAVLSKAFSGEFTLRKLGDLVDRIKAGKNLRCDERPPHPHEKGVVKVSAVTWGDFRADQSKTLPPDFEPDEDTRIKAGDFLFSRANTIELVGAVVIVADAPDNLYLSDKILRLEFSEPVGNWLLWYLRSPMGREALMNISSGNQLSMRNIGQKSLLSLAVPYADKASRNDIVRRIESTFARIDRLAAQAKRALELVGKLDEAILAKAFRGELVPQDDNDEPADKLLERIRAEREAAPKARRGRGRKA